MSGTCRNITDICLIALGAMFLLGHCVGGLMEIQLLHLWSIVVVGCVLIALPLIYRIVRSISARRFWLRKAGEYALKGEGFVTAKCVTDQSHGSAAVQLFEGEDRKRLGDLLRAVGARDGLYLIAWQAREYDEPDIQVRHLDDQASLQSREMSSQVAAFQLRRYCLYLFHLADKVARLDSYRTAV